MIKLGISTCPNDTFAFHGLLTGKVSVPGLELSIELLDIQQLNNGLQSGRLDVAKGSFYSACRLSGSHVVLPVGAAIGFGVGPIIVSSRGHDFQWETARAMCPGSGTTASFLFQHFHPEVPYLVQGVFSGIPSAVASKHVDVGVLIHEGRFTFEDQGLQLVEDLGDMWEKSYQLPLPLGGLFAKQTLSATVLDQVTSAVQESLHYALAHRDEVVDTMARYAQEFSPEVLWKHVELYVNSETFVLSEKGRAAVSYMFDVANEGGLLGIAAPPLNVL